jgi:hypothetical protein
MQKGILIHRAKQTLVRLAGKTAALLSGNSKPTFIVDLDAARSGMPSFETSVIRSWIADRPTHPLRKENPPSHKRNGAAQTIPAWAVPQC